MSNPKESSVKLSALYQKVQIPRAKQLHHQVGQPDVALATQTQSISASISNHLLTVCSSALALGKLCGQNSYPRQA